MNKVLLIILATLLSTGVTIADDHDHDNISEDKHEHGEEKGHEEDEHHHDHGGGKSIGEGKAIKSVDEKKGFELSPEAIATLKIQFMPIKVNEFKISMETLVTSKGIKGIYRFRDGFFKFVTVELKNKIENQYLIHIEDIKDGDQIVTHGVGLLRVSDVYSTDESEYGHSH